MPFHSEHSALYFRGREQYRSLEFTNFSTRGGQFVLVKLWEAVEREQIMNFLKLQVKWTTLLFLDTDSDSV